MPITSTENKQLISAHLQLNLRALLKSRGRLPNFSPKHEPVGQWSVQHDCSHTHFASS